MSLYKGIIISPLYLYFTKRILNHPYPWYICVLISVILPLYFRQLFSFESKMMKLLDKQTEPFYVPLKVLQTLRSYPRESDLDNLERFWKQGGIIRVALVWLIVVSASLQSYKVIAGKSFR